MSEHLEPSPGGERDTDGLDAALELFFQRTGRGASSEEEPLPVRIGPEGRYETEGEIGRGGMGVVLAAHDHHVGRKVAVKLLRSRNGSASRRFVDEGHIAAQLQHPGIVPVYDLSEDGADRPWFTMKLVQGETLKAMLRARSHPGAGLQRMLGVFQRVCEAVAYAHERGVIHRDLKPANVMADRFGEIQVMDWGLAKVLGDEDEGHLPGKHRSVETTRDRGRGWGSFSGSVFGTPAYMAPEQARGDVHLVDRRTDVFALGAMLCEILTGAPPYRAEGPEEIREAAARADLDEARARLAACEQDPALVALAVDCLASDPGDRPADAGAVARRLGDHLARAAERTRRAELDAVRARARAAQERRVRRLLVALVFLLLAGAAATFLVLEERRQRRQRSIRTVGDAVSRARDLRTEARASPGASLAVWSQAEEAAASAARLARREDVDEETRRRALEVRERIVAEARAARTAMRQRERDRELLRELDEVSLVLGAEMDLARTDRAFQRVFARLGIDCERLDVEAAAAVLRSTTIPARLAAALDRWAMVRTAVEKEEGFDGPRFGHRLADLARATDGDPRRDRIRAAWQEGRLDELERMAQGDAVLELPPETLHVITLLLEAARGPDVAVALLERVVHRHPGDFWTHVYLGSYLDEVTPPRLDDAALHYHAALALAPDSLTARVNLAAVERRRGKLERSLRLLRDAERKRPEMALIVRGIGLTLFAMGRLDEAEAAFLRVLKMEGEGYSTLYSLGEVHLERRRHERALDCWTRCTELRPADHLAHHQRGVALRRLGRRDEAERSFRKAISLEEDFGSSWGSLAVLRADAGDHEEAERLYRKALSYDAGVAAHWYGLGNVRYARGDPEDAIACFDACLQRDPGYVRALINKGQVLRLIGRSREALPVLERAREAAEERSFTPPSDLDAAIQACRQACVLDERLEGALTGTHFPQPQEEWARLAAHAVRHGRPVAAARIWQLAHDDEAARAVCRENRPSAVRTAVRAGLGRGHDARRLDPEGRMAWRRQALEWLRVESVELRVALEGTLRERAHAHRRVRAVIADPALAPVQGDALERLPEAERADWRALWSDLRELEQELGSG